MKGYLTLHKDGCLIVVGDSTVRVENSLSGCIITPSRGLANIWCPVEGNRLRFEVLRFEPAPSKGKAEAFAIKRDGWTLQLYLWREEGSYVLELWINDLKDTCVAALEWWFNEDGVTAYVEGETKEFIRFAEVVIKETKNTEHQNNQKGVTNNENHNP
jgi:hypothetical protein